jgi:hypothetical protein
MIWLSARKVQQPNTFMIAFNLEATIAYSAGEIGIACFQYIEHYQIIRVIELDERNRTCLLMMNFGLIITTVAACASIFAPVFSPSYSISPPSVRIFFVLRAVLPLIRCRLDWFTHRLVRDLQASSGPGDCHVSQVKRTALLLVVVKLQKRTRKRMILLQMGTSFHFTLCACWSPAAAVFSYQVVVVQIYTGCLFVSYIFKTIPVLHKAIASIKRDPRNS